MMQTQLAMSTHDPLQTQIELDGRLGEQQAKLININAERLDSILNVYVKNSNWLESLDMMLERQPNLAALFAQVDCLLPSHVSYIEPNARGSDSCRYPPERVKLLDFDLIAHESESPIFPSEVSEVLSPPLTQSRANNSNGAVCTYAQRAASVVSMATDALTNASTYALNSTGLNSKVKKTNNSNDDAFIDLLKNTKVYSRQEMILKIVRQLLLGLPQSVANLAPNSTRHNAAAEASQSLVQLVNHANTDFDIHPDTLKNARIVLLKDSQFEGKAISDGMGFSDPMRFFSFAIANRYVRESNINRLGGPIWQTVCRQGHDWLVFVSVMVRCLCLKGKDAIGKRTQFPIAEDLMDLDFESKQFDTFLDDVFIDSSVFQFGSKHKWIISIDGAAVQVDSVYDVIPYVWNNCERHFQIEHKPADLKAYPLMVYRAYSMATGMRIQPWMMESEEITRKAVHNKNQIDADFKAKQEAKQLQDKLKKVAMLQSRLKTHEETNTNPNQPHEILDVASGSAREIASKTEGHALLLGDSSKPELTKAVIHAWEASFQKQHECVDVASINYVNELQGVDQITSSTSFRHDHRCWLRAAWLSIVMQLDTPKAAMDAAQFAKFGSKTKHNQMTALMVAMHLAARQKPSLYLLPDASGRPIQLFRGCTIRDLLSTYYPEGLSAFKESTLEEQIEGYLALSTKQIVAGLRDDMGKHLMGEALNVYLRSGLASANIPLALHRAFGLPVVLYEKPRSGRATLHVAAPHDHALLKWAVAVCPPNAFGHVDVQRLQQTEPLIDVPEEEGSTDNLMAVIHKLPIIRLQAEHYTVWLPKAVMPAQPLPEVNLSLIPETLGPSHSILDIEQPDVMQIDAQPLPQLHNAAPSAPHAPYPLETLMVGNQTVRIGIAPNDEYEIRQILDCIFDWHLPSVGTSNAERVPVYRPTVLVSCVLTKDYDVSNREHYDLWEGLPRRMAQMLSQHQTTGFIPLNATHTLGLPNFTDFVGDIPTQRFPVQNPAGVVGHLPLMKMRLYPKLLMKYGYIDFVKPTFNALCQQLQQLPPHGQLLLLNDSKTENKAEVALLLRCLIMLLQVQSELVARGMHLNNSEHGVRYQMAYQMLSAFEAHAPDLFEDGMIYTMARELL